MWGWGWTRSDYHTLIHLYIYIYTRNSKYINRYRIYDTCVWRVYTRMYVYIYAFSSTTLIGACDVGCLHVSSRFWHFRTILSESKTGGRFARLRVLWPEIIIVSLYPNAERCPTDRSFDHPLYTCNFYYKCSGDVVNVFKNTRKHVVILNSTGTGRRSFRGV